ncbi:MAG: hypothetical protein HKM98_08090 [Gammaproteobacteria bacterium]|nr:hypothetical protein [Gammaproteobacteria bacterium]
MNKDFEKNLQKTLAAEAGRVDQATRDELARRRRLALDAASPGQTRRWLWLPAGALAAALVAVIMVRPFTTEQMPLVEVASAEIDMEILLADDFELIEELEFYEWLAVTDDAG